MTSCQACAPPPRATAKPVCAPPPRVAKAKPMRRPVLAIAHASARHSSNRWLLARCRIS
jgi:hypothetical protein